MKIPTNNPMHRENCHFYVDDLPDAPPVDLAAFFEDEGAQADMINDAMAIGHAPAIASALGLVARMRGMSGIAAATGIKRQQLYRTLGEDGNPTLDTLTRVVSALGYRLAVERGAAA